MVQFKKYFLFIALLGFLNLLFASQLNAQTCPPLPTNTGTVTATVNVPSSGNFVVWSRINPPNSTNNSYWLQFDNNCAINVGDAASIPTNTWTWVNYQNGSSANKISINLTAGTHVVHLIGKEPGVKIDKLLLTDTVCTPTGMGSNCESSSTGTTINLTLLLHGIGKGGDNSNGLSQGNFNPVHPQRSVDIEIYNASNQLVLTKTGNVTFNSGGGNFTGTIDLGALPTGVYIIKVKSSQYLKTLIPGIQSLTLGSSHALAPLSLIAGDINNDNQANIIDLNLLMGCYSDLELATSCTTTNKLLADLNDDGNVNHFDYNLFLRELAVRKGQ